MGGLILLFELGNVLGGIAHIVVDYRVRTEQRHCGYRAQYYCLVRTELGNLLH